MGKKAAYYEDCRALYLKGRTLEEISTAVNVSMTTLSRWKRDGDWERQRAEINRHPMRMAEKIDRAMEAQVDELLGHLAKGERPPDTLADGIAKLGAVRKAIASAEDLPRQVIYVTDMLAQYARRTIQDDKLLGEISQLLAGFYQEFKEKQNG